MKACIRTTAKPDTSFIHKRMFYPDRVRDRHNLVLSILPAMKEFYAIIALQALAKPVLFKHSHEEWGKELSDYAEFYFNGLARIIYDYTVSAVFFELRHMRRSNLEINFPCSDGETRESCLYYIHEYNPISILEAGKFIFNSDNNNWRDSYGGDAWCDISKAGLMYGKIPNMVFIDHCNDLSHNSGVYYDKEANILSMRKPDMHQTYPKMKMLNCCDSSEGLFVRFLDFKRVSEDPKEILKLAQTFTLQNLIIKANNLGIIKLFKTKFKFDIPDIPYGITRFRTAHPNQFYIGENEEPIMEYGYWELDDMIRNYHPIEFEKKELNIHDVTRHYRYNENGNRVSRRRAV